MDPKVGRDEHFLSSPQLVKQAYFYAFVYAVTSTAKNQQNRLLIDVANTVTNKMRPNSCDLNIKQARNKNRRNWFGNVENEKNGILFWRQPILRKAQTKTKQKIQSVNCAITSAIKKINQKFFIPNKSTQKLSATNNFYVVQIWLLDLSLHFRLCLNKHSQKSTKQSPY